MLELKELKEQIDQFLEQQMPSDIDQPTLASSMEYSVNAGGKRLRPALTLTTVQIFGGQLNQNVMKASTAIELLHTYSLIHDDLPAMDNDDLRRGKPTNHKKFGAGMATLAGDGLLTMAFQWLTDCSKFEMFSLLNKKVVFFFFLRQFTEKIFGCIISL